MCWRPNRPGQLPGPTPHLCSCAPMRTYVHTDANAPAQLMLDHFKAHRHAHRCKRARNCARSHMHTHERAPVPKSAASSRDCERTRLAASAIPVTSASDDVSTLVANATAPAEGAGGIVRPGGTPCRAAAARAHAHPHTMSWAHVNGW